MVAQPGRLEDAEGLVDMPQLTKTEQQDLAKLLLEDHGAEASQRAAYLGLICRTCGDWAGEEAMCEVIDLIHKSLNYSRTFALAYNTGGLLADFLTTDRRLSLPFPSGTSVEPQKAA